MINQSMIKISNLHKRFGKVHALRGVNLDIGQGELFAYLGPNGSGKTTTIRILTSLTNPTEGEAFLNGYSVLKQRLDAKMQCGVVAQHINLDNELTVEENLSIHGMLFGMSKKDRAMAIDEFLEYVDLADRKKTLIKQLSGGLKRRVMIARALMHRPKIVFLDEPTVGLDPSIRRKIWSFIKKAQNDGATILLTTHYIEEAEFLADRVAFLDTGSIITIDSPQNLMDRMGAWALDTMNNGDISTEYFKSREQAEASAQGRQYSGFTVRRVNLEDAFIALTGKKAIGEAAPAKSSHGGAHSSGHGHGGHGSHQKGGR
ncbi:ABC transporter related [Desulfatibacillum aliphaticivorans]|uniref:ABC transporter related n=1 Tax=Desulfatibacillum aliphaticivorans TaxID=218208 RepID=B8FC17_DESAL|nr:ABC transporter ATP-binding protein [Desulfatibacillum aliphaticivorans]ACL05222.1 ABC transporter related [Desulfatibacillum aliphaticivorans]